MVDANVLLAVKLIVNAVVTIAGLWFLVWYEVNRKWNKDDLSAKGITALPMFFVRYRVAIIIAAVLVPDWADLLPALLGIGK